MKERLVISDANMNDPGVRYGIWTALRWTQKLFTSVGMQPDRERDHNLGRILMDGLKEIDEWLLLVGDDQMDELLLRVTKATEPFEKKRLQISRR